MNVKSLSLVLSCMICIFASSLTAAAQSFGKIVFCPHGGRHARRRSRRYLLRRRDRKNQPEGRDRGIKCHAQYPRCDNIFAAKSVGDPPYFGELAINGKVAIVGPVRQAIDSSAKFCRRDATQSYFSSHGSSNKQHCAQFQNSKRNVRHQWRWNLG